MAIVGFNFTKISAEKSGNVSGKIGINNNIMITDAKDIQVNIASKDSKGLLLKFKYICEYEPKVGKMTLEGDVISIEPEAKVKECIESWKKDKKIDPEITKIVLSHVLSKATVQAIILSKDLALPPPIPLPKMGGEKAKAKPKKA